MAFKRTGKSNDDRPRRSFGSDRPRFSDRPAGRSFGRPRGGDLELFDVKCAKCGIDTKVPFKPTGERPVLCRDCFKKPEDARRSFSAAGPSAGDIREINEKLDKIIRALNIE